MARLPRPMWQRTVSSSSVAVGASELALPRPGGSAAMSSPAARSQSNFWAGNVAAVLVVAAWVNKRVARALAACTAAAGVASNGAAG